MKSWKELTHLQIGKYGEYFAKMAFTKLGFDVYTSEVDDKGIDFVIRKNHKEYFDIQVKTIRRPTSYVFMKKECFSPKDNLFLALIIFEENEIEPTLLIIPSEDWTRGTNKAFVNRNYGEGKKSKPEWGLNITKSNIENLKKEYCLKDRLPF
jgi:hypothetical protein